MNKYRYTILSFAVIALVFGGSFHTSASNSGKKHTSAVVKVSSPENASVLATLSPTIEWEELGESYKYDLILSTTADFSNIILKEESIDDNVYNVNSGLLKHGNTYYYKLRSNIDDTENSWSSSYSFSTNSVSCDVKFLDSEYMIVSYAQSESSIDLDYELENATDVKVELYDNTGALLSYQLYGDLSSGVHKTSIDYSSLELGSYLVMISTGSKVSNTKINLYF